MFSIAVTTMYFSAYTTTIICKENTYSNFIGNYVGGVFLLHQVVFYDNLSVYKNNSALYGGAIFCASCHLI